MLYNTRTDLASESLRLLGKNMEALSEEKGIIASEENFNGMTLFSVEILNQSGAEILGKPIGKYFTLDFSKTVSQNTSNCVLLCSICDLIRRLCARKNRVLVSALGNPDVTPDALGALAAQNILVTNHLKSDPLFSDFNSVSLCRPGVLGTSGIESATQISLLSDHIRPDLVILIDSLAGADLSTLCRCVQLSNSGISPGSGIGNNRHEISPKALKTQVISIGVPTVIDTRFLDFPDLNSMFLTPKDIDSQVRRCAKLIAYAINLALHDGLTVEDIDMLLS